MIIRDLKSADVGGLAACFGALPGENLTFVQDVHDPAVIDILVNNAGVGTAIPTTRATPAQLRAVININTNFSGCYWMAQACGR